MRVLNNRHWVSDVLAGAGIGILSTEIAYGLSDLIFKDKGLRRTDLENTANIVEHPSFFSINMGVGFSNHDLSFDFNNEDLDEGLKFSFKPSTVVGAEGAYFFNKYIGIGGRLRVRSTPVEGFGDLMDETRDAFDEMKTEGFWQDVFEGEVKMVPGMSPIKDYTVTIESDHLTEFSATAGIYLNLPLSRHFALGAKLLTGRSIIDDVDLDVNVTGHKIGFNPETFDLTMTNDTYQHKWDLLNIKGNNSATYGTGISLTYAYKSSFSWRVFADYDFTKKTYEATFAPYGFLPTCLGIEDMMNPEEIQFGGTTRKNMNHFTIGGSFCISF